MVVGGIKTLLLLGLGQLAKPHEYSNVSGGVPINSRLLLDRGQPSPIVLIIPMPHEGRGRGAYTAAFCLTVGCRSQPA